LQHCFIDSSCLFLTDPLSVHSFLEMHIPLLALVLNKQVCLGGMDLAAAKTLMRGRTGHRMTSDTSEALPFYLQVWCCVYTQDERSRKGRESINGCM